MKIGILTFHFGINYGGILQCYALQEYLISCGNDVKIIDYIPKNFKNRPYLIQLFILKLNFTNFIKTIKRIRYGHRQKKQFQQFKNKYLKLTDKYDFNKLSKIDNDFDAIIVGSDQIWNPSQHKLGSYFLSHLELFNGKRISYAPCCALNKVDIINKDNLRIALEKFTMISVRNKETENFVFELINERPPIVLDPTMLWSYRELLNQKPLIEDRYILTYILGEEINGGHKEAINNIKMKTGNLKVVSIILTDNKPQLFNWSDKTYWYASPLEWLNLFYYSTFVYTDSYHGVLFSIKFHKQFLAYYTEKIRASRFVDLADRFKDLSSFIVNSIDDAQEKGSFKMNIDYQSLEEMLISELNKSKQFLTNALN